MKGSIKKGLFIFLVILLTAIMISGCGKKDGKTVENNGGPEPEAIVLKVTDLKGNTVSFDKMPERIVSLSPSNTEILFALGAGSKVVGVTSYCDYPAEAKKVQKIGTFDGPNLELIKKVNPDVVLAGGSIQADFIKTMTDNGIKVVSTEAADFSSIYKSIDLVGKITGTEAKAKEINGNIESTLKEIGEKTKDKPKIKVFYVVWTEPLMTAGKGTFIDEIIKAAGGENVASTVDGWANYSAEQLVKDNPEMLLSAVHSTDKGMNIADFKSNKIFGKLDAVKNGKIYVMSDDNIMSRPGPRIADAIKEVARVLHEIK